MDLKEVYGKICELHSERFSCIRIGQMFNNFELWHKSNYGRDLFYESNADLLDHFEKYLSEFKSVLPERNVDK